MATYSSHGELTQFDETYTDLSICIFRILIQPSIVIDVEWK
jgi:hypothetical protein